ncbi:glutathione S-transferase [Lentithecium fluviatile CBS 122367]|uniref:Glutathione S-transferase n=1 Tax=Lentithecium fluviatile CBS 122367 TaxID=1168545 RepID=A0A6G1IWW4_9PLEO|nr:glutathione S-transferase [Lentithecium fluviatile CBS 122367]
MAPFATIHTVTFIVHAPSTRIFAAANLNNLELVVSPVQIGTTNQFPAYLAKFPLGKIPALETPSGFLLTEGSAIAKYIAESGPRKVQLMGRTTEDRALVQQWISFADSELSLKHTEILAPIVGTKKYDAAFVREKEKEFVRVLRRLEGHLRQEGRVWLVRDDEVNMADLSVAAALLYPLKVFMDAEYRRDYPGIVGWFEKLMGVEGVGKEFGAAVRFCERRPELDGSEGFDFARLAGG